jgi:hypothetical protein
MTTRFSAQNILALDVLKGIPMMWWRGSGLWMAGIVAFIVYSASQQGSPLMLAGGFVAAAVIIHLVRDEESSFYSLRVRYWPPLLILCAIVASLEAYLRR